MSTSKVVRLGRRSHLLAGDNDDPYYSNVGDGTDDDLAALLHRIVEPDAVIVDVGANIGVTSLIMSQVVPQGTVIAVEAGRRNFELLVANLESNSCSNVVPVFAAASDRCGTVEFSENTAYGGVVEGLRLAGGGYVVDAITVDALAAERSLTRVDLIKVDVEGHEAEVLAGAAEVIDHHNPVIVLEFNLWTIMAYSDDNPLRFLGDLVAAYEFVGRVRDDGSVEALPGDAVVGFVHECVTSGACVHNLVLRRRSAGFLATHDPSGEAEGAVDTMQDDQGRGDESPTVEDASEHDDASRERDELRRELLQLRADYQAVISSRSWRYTELIRRVLR